MGTTGKPLPLSWYVPTRAQNIIIRPKSVACLWAQRVSPCHCTNEGSKHVIPRNDVPFVDPNVVPRNFWSQTPKNENLGWGLWTGLSSVNDKHSNTYITCNLTKPIMMEFFLHGTSTTSGQTRVVPRLPPKSPNNSVADGGHIILNLVKC